MHRVLKWTPFKSTIQYVQVLRKEGKIGLGECTSFKETGPPNFHFITMTTSTPSLP